MLLGIVQTADRNRWPELNEWLREKIELFDDVFRPRVKRLDATEYAISRTTSDGVAQ
jgi:hypothetical protein